MKVFSINALIVLLTLFVLPSLEARESKIKKSWNQNYHYIYAIDPISFHYDHGVLAGSYPAGEENIEVSFDDVSRYLGHVCLCGAGGFKVSQIAVNLLGGSEKKLEKGDFTLISSNDHTVSDVVAYVSGCVRRKKAEISTYFIDETIKNPKREYQYYIAYHPDRTAVHVTYRKHLLVGNEKMDRLWNIELAYEKNPASVKQDDLKLYRENMESMVKEVLLGKKPDLFEAKLIKYDDFLARLKKLEP